MVVATAGCAGRARKREDTNFGMPRHQNADGDFFLKQKIEKRKKKTTWGRWLVRFFSQLVAVRRCWSRGRRLAAFAHLWACFQVSGVARAIVLPSRLCPPALSSAAGMTVQPRRPHGELRPLSWWGVDSLAQVDYYRFPGSGDQAVAIRWLVGVLFPAFSATGRPTLHGCVIYDCD